MNKDRLVIVLKTVDSTNAYASRLLQKKPDVAEGTLIIAEEQTAGKGQGDHSWESHPGKNATFSLILRPDFLSPESQFLLNEAVALGILDFLMNLTHIKLHIKWPNDIYAGKLKLGGILIWNSICGDRFETCIAGIGLNVNQVDFDRGIPNPISLKSLTEKDYSVREIINGTTSSIGNRICMLRSGMQSVISRDYRDSLLGAGEWLIFRIDGVKMKGRILDSDESGLLIMEMEDGSFRKLNHGDAEFML